MAQQTPIGLHNEAKPRQGRGSTEVRLGTREGELPSIAVRISVVIRFVAATSPNAIGICLSQRSTIMCKINGFFGLTLLMVPFTAMADWTYIDSIDPFTDEPSRAAIWEDESHRIQLSREKDGKAVWMYLTRKLSGSFEPDTPIEYRVDQLVLRGENMIDLHELLERYLNKPSYIWEPGTVAFSTWHGDPNEPGGCGFIGELLHGETLRVRYWISKVDRETFSVDLTGSDESILIGLDLSSEDCAQ